MTSRSGTRSRPSACCARSSRPPTSAPPIPNARRASFRTSCTEPRFQIGLRVMQRLPYNFWRETDPEDTLRFHALRLQEVGLIRSSPQTLIAEHTDWRFLNELKRELKV